MSESDVEELDWTSELKVTEHLWDEKEEISEPNQYSGSTSVSDELDFYKKDQKFPYTVKA